LSISSVFIVSPRSLRSSQAVTADGPLSTAHLPRPDPARGVFETLLVVDGRPVELDAHLDRLATSVRELFGAPTMARVSGPARILAETRARGLAPAADGVNGASPALARLRLTLAPDDRGALDLSATTANVEPTTLVPGSEGGVTLGTVAVSGGLGDHKWADRRLLEQAASALGGALPLIVDGDGNVLEAERANVFAVHGGALTTPPADGRILPGVARARVIAIARDLGIEISERPIALTELAAADAAFLTGSIRGIEPIATIDSRAQGRTDALPARIAATLRERWLGSSA
jgi:para-aminobenzoate synthetase/4-amino-4-deoxychorismate lyase